MDLSKIIIKEITSVITVYSPRGRYDTMVNRSSYGLSFTTDGQITYTHNGKAFVSDCNTAVILPKGQTYTIYSDIDGTFPVINFECEGFSADTIITLPIENIKPVMKEFENLKSLFIYKKSPLLIMSSLYNLIYSIATANAYGKNPLYPAIEFMESNFAFEISNSILAQKCHISEEHFRKQFTKIYGISPKQYIINIRLNMAKQLLSEGTLKINAISEKCGFSNPYHFCRLFKDKTGLTPSEYTKQNRVFKI